MAATVIGIDPDPSTRGGVDTRLNGFPPRTEFALHRDAGMRGGNDIVILHQFGAYSDRFGRDHVDWFIWRAICWAFLLLFFEISGKIQVQKVL